MNPWESIRTASPIFQAGLMAMAVLYFYGYGMQLLHRGLAWMINQAKSLVIHFVMEPFKKWRTKEKRDENQDRLIQAMDRERRHNLTRTIYWDH